MKNQTANPIYFMKDREAFPKHKSRHSIHAVSTKNVLRKQAEYFHIIQGEFHNIRVARRCSIVKIQAAIKHNFNLT